LEIQHADERKDTAIVNIAFEDDWETIKEKSGK